MSPPAEELGAPDGAGGGCRSLPAEVLGAGGGGGCKLIAAEELGAPGGGGGGASGCELLYEFAAA